MNYNGVNAENCMYQIKKRTENYKRKSWLCSETCLIAPTHGNTRTDDAAHATICRHDK